MEKEIKEFAIKLELIIPVMSDFIQKLQNFNSKSVSEKRSFYIREIFKSVENLKNCFKKSLISTESEIQTPFFDQIEKIFNEFSWNVNCRMKSDEFSELMICCNSLTESIIKMLGKRNCGVLIFEIYCRLCIKLINELNYNIEETDEVLRDLLLFQSLAKGFLSSIKVLKKFWFIIVLPNQKCSVIVCLIQSYKIMHFLNKIIDKRQVHLFKYLLDRLKQCLLRLVNVLHTAKEEYTNSDFINIMDSCLCKLDELSNYYNKNKKGNESINEIKSSLKLFIDELLCHAMTISHLVSSESDCNLIKSYSQKVLSEFQKIRNSSEEDEDSDIDAKAEILSDTLCQLEQIVNTAVLNAVLDVFIDVNGPLRNLVGKCNSSTHILGNRYANDLEGELSAFDEHMDRVVHIGLFAISCSTDVRRIAEIRSCLASLESLEAELVTATVSIYLHPSECTQSVFQIILQNWLEEMSELKNLIDLILDPAAFCQVVEKRIYALLYELRGGNSASISDIKSNLCKVVVYTKKLIKTLLKSVELDEEPIRETTKNLIKNLQFAYQECEAALSLLNDEAKSELVSQRIVKRVTMVIAAINALNSNFANISSAEDVSRTYSHNSVETEYLNFISVNPTYPIDIEVLTPYINKGKQRTKERTVLYNTPKNFQTKSERYNLQIPSDVKRQKSFQSRPRMKCARLLRNSDDWNNSLDLELTKLLDDLTSLGDSFSKTYEVKAGTGTEKENSGSEGDSENEENLKSNGKTFLGSLMRKELHKSLSDLSKTCSLYIDVDSLSEYHTPERLHDLTFVRKKIDFLIRHPEK